MTACRPIKPRDNPTRRRIGIDLGGTKIEGVILDAGGPLVHKLRQPSPKNDYDATLHALRDLTLALEQATSDESLPLGIGMPGGISRRTGRVHNANSTWLNGRDIMRDISQIFPDRQIAISNDANCFALSEATDGAAAGASSMIGIILGTGVGGGIVQKGRLLDGPMGIGGEWGHNPLPWADTTEHPGPQCWCGRTGCLEMWISGPAMATDHKRQTNQALTAIEIAQLAESGDTAAQATLDRYVDRLARGLAHLVNIVDPEIIVIGGGLGQIDYIYNTVPELMARYVFSDAPYISLKKPIWGDASGTRGAARLNPLAAADG